MATAQAPAASRGGYPIQVIITDERELNRLWGIPVFGHLVRGFMAIPHIVVLQVLGFVTWIWFLVGWIPILLNGRVPAIMVKPLTEYIHRGTRVAGYAMFLLPGEYPPLEPGAPGPIDVEFDLESLEINRLWGIPFIGFIVRILAVLPQLIVLSFAAIIVVLSLLVLWIPILASGRYPEWAVSFYGSVIRYGTRVSAYILLLPLPYPPLWFD
jgi:hypothetical protein